MVESSCRFPKLVNLHCKTYGHVNILYPEKYATVL